MTNNIINQVSFLRTSREFPEELHQLAVQCNKSYVDIANCVNARIISLFTTNKPSINGENWFLGTNQRQQGLRQVYLVTSTAPINIGFKISSISQFTPKCYGSFTDNTNWYGLIFGSKVAIAGQVSFFIASTGSTTTDQIQFQVGVGAPAVNSGIIVLEWLSNI